MPRGQRALYMGQPYRQRNYQLGNRIVMVLMTSGLLVKGHQEQSVSIRQAPAATARSGTQRARQTASRRLPQVTWSTPRTSATGPTALASTLTCRFFEVSFLVCWFTSRRFSSFRVFFGAHVPLVCPGCSAPSVRFLTSSGPTRHLPCQGNLTIRWRRLLCL